MKGTKVKGAMKAKRNWGAALLLLALVLSCLATLSACSSGRTRSRVVTQTVTQAVTQTVTQAVTQTVTQAIPIPVKASITTEGQAYFPTMDGKVFFFPGPIKEAILTPDRQRVVHLSDHGVLSVSDLKLEEVKEVARNISGFDYVRNQGFFYRDENDITYRYLFNGGLTTELSNVSDLELRVAERTVSCIYTEDKDVFLLKPSSQAGIRVDSVASGSRVEFMIVTDDGEMAAWYSDGGDSGVLTTYDNGSLSRQEIVLDDNNHHRSPFGDLSRDHQILFFTAYADKFVFIKHRGQEGQFIQLPLIMNFFYFWTEEGYFYQTDSKNINNLYTTLCGAEGTSLYQIDRKGNLERILSDLNYFLTSNRVAAYLMADGSLHWEKVKDELTGRGDWISSDVVNFKLSIDGNYIYFLKDNGNDLNDLYGYKRGDDKPQRIAADVGSQRGIDIAQYFCSTEGNIVYYFEDWRKADGGDHSAETGSLIEYDFKSKVKKRIATDVLSSDYFYPAMVSGLDYFLVNPKGFTFMKYSHLDGNDGIIADLCYYNGSEFEVVAKNIVYDQSWIY